MKQIKWEAKLIRHKNANRIAVYFEKNADLISRIKQIENAQWSWQKNVWHLPDTEENRERFKIASCSNYLPSEEGIAQIEKFKHWLRSKRYSESTLKTYSDALKSFLIFCNTKAIKDITNDDVILQPLPIFGCVSKRQISYQSYQLLMLRMWVCCKLAEFSTYPYSASFLNAIGVFPFRASCGLR